MFLLPFQTLHAIVNKFVFSRKYLVLLFGFLLHLSYGSILTFGESFFNFYLMSKNKPNVFQRKHDDLYYVVST